MRKVGRYAFTARVTEHSALLEIWEELQKRVTDWIDQKGNRYRTSDGDEHLQLYRGNRLADLLEEDKSSKAGKLFSLRLNEPIGESQEFETTVKCVRNDEVIGVDATLRLGYDAPRVSPLQSFDARCPGVIRDILNFSVPWQVGGWKIQTSSQEVHTDAEIRTLVSALKSPARTMPFVVVSEHENFALHPELPARLAYDLTGLARVFRISAETSWEITKALGKEWSCFNGAIRIYWPFDTSDNPYRHGLWTREKLMRYATSTEEAADKIRHQIRRKILGLSTMTIPELKLVGEIERTYRREQRAQRLSRAKEDSDWKKLALSLEEDIAELEEDLQQKEDLSRALKESLQQKCAVIEQLDEALKAAQRAGHDETDLVENPKDIEPATSVPPTTVNEALTEAREKHNDALVFSKDVGAGVDELAEDAGPPDKVLRHLNVLANMGRQYQEEGNLGTSKWDWLKQRNVESSRESDRIRNNDREMEKRTWPFQHGKEAFEFHTKPTDNVPPDRCVRIYFKWSDARNKLLVGWVGRHP